MNFYSDSILPDAPLLLTRQWSTCLKKITTSFAQGFVRQWFKHFILHLSAWPCHQNAAFSLYCVLMTWHHPKKNQVFCEREFWNCAPSLLGCLSMITWPEVWTKIFISMLKGNWLIHSANLNTWLVHHYSERSSQVKPQLWCHSYRYLFCHLLSGWSA